MPTCVVKCCSRSTLRDKKEQGITFHRFPKENEWRRDWIQIIRECRRQMDWNPSKSSVVCSEHFQTSDLYTTKGGLVRVVAFAVPQKFLWKPPSDEQQNEQPAVSERSFDASLYRHALSNEERLLPIEFNGHTPVSEGQSILTNNLPVNTAAPNISLQGSKCDVNPDDVSLASDDDHQIEPANDDDCCSFWCNECQKGIVKWRFVCVQCPDYDLCGECAVRGDHPQHCLLRVPEEIDPDKARKLLKLIRYSLTVNLNSDETTSSLGDDETTSNLGEDATMSPQGADHPVEIKIEVEEEQIGSVYKDPLHDTVPDVDSVQQPSMRLATLGKTLDMIESEPTSPRTKRTAQPATSVTAKKRKEEKKKTPNVVVITPVNKNAKKISKSLEINKLPAPHIEENTSDLVIKKEPLEIEIEISQEDSTMDSFQTSQEDELKTAVDSLNALEDTTENEKDTFVRERLKDSLQFGEPQPETS